MISEWARKKILIWGKTRPELSKTYREIVCTGGVFADNKRLVRLYPIPLRYMDDDKIFKKYQWIEAWVKKSTSDTRPESYKIRSDEITIGETIPSKSGCWDKRAEWIMQSGNIFASVESLQDKQIADQTSLGLVKPEEIIDVKAERYSKSESDKYWRNYEELVRQMELPIDDDSGREIRPLKPPDYRFKIKFRCRDTRCAYSGDREQQFRLIVNADSGAS